MQAKVSYKTNDAEPVATTVNPEPTTSDYTKRTTRKVVQLVMKNMKIHQPRIGLCARV